MNNDNDFILGGKGDGNFFIEFVLIVLVHLWDRRGPKTPVKSINMGLGDRTILSCRVIGDELVAMSGRQLV